MIGRGAGLTEPRSGAWGSSSADFMHLVRQLYAHSGDYAANIDDGNCSPYALCAIPMLLSSLRCLMVEYESYPPEDKAALESLTKPNDFSTMWHRYAVPETLRIEAELLQEVRNEILHPAHRPTGTRDNWPEYLRKLKDRGLTQSRGRADSDYILLSQMQSHRLFSWAYRVTRDLAAQILSSNPQKTHALGNFLFNYLEYPGFSGHGIVPPLDHLGVQPCQAGAVRGRSGRSTNL
jgi:hypothetical protein